MTNDIYERDLICSTLHWDIRLNPNQKYLGRCVVILKRSCPSLAKVRKEEIIEWLEIVRCLEELLRETFGATMFNWACSMNHAYQTDPPDPQVHWHIIPRYAHPVQFCGKVFCDEHFGRRSVSDADVVSDDMFEAIMQKLRERRLNIHNPRPLL